MSEDKKTLFIEGKEVEFTDEPNLLEVIRKAGMNVPTFCYRPDLTQFGACRMCVVEVEYPNGRVMVNSSCTMPPEAGIKVKINSQRVRKIRKTVLELLLTNHDRECTTCDKSGQCELQQYSEEYGVRKLKYPTLTKEEMMEIDDKNPSLVRDPNKCILCGACVRACSEFQGHSVLGFANRGSRTVVQPMNGRLLAEVDCVFCGQCQAVCPTGALTIKSDVDKVWDEINNKEKKVVVQIAPSVRVAIGEMFGLKPGENTIGKIYAALRRIGFDLVFDTNFSADLTITEEATEFVDRLTNKGLLPMFTSCCPAWVRYMETQHPDMLGHLSSCKSPEGMMSSVLKDLLPKHNEEYTEDNTVVVSIMPCTAKKYEAKRSQLRRNGKFDTDYVLTTKEFGRMIKEAGIDFENLEPEQADSPFGGYTGAGTIFGASGGVAEAAARTAYYYVTGENIPETDIKGMRGVDKNSRSKTVELDIKGTHVVVRVVSTLKEAEKAIQEIKNGTANFQLLEVMACPGGCIGGGGQPKAETGERKNMVESRIDSLYRRNSEMKLRKSHENPELKQLYAEFYEKPLSPLAEQMPCLRYAGQRISAA